MNISVIGTGYVGLTTAVGFAVQGHKVYCVDIDENKIDLIKSGKAPIFEENLEENLKKVLDKGLLIPTTGLSSAIQDTDISFICVGTPSNDDGSIDLKYIYKASEDAGGQILKDKDEYHVFVIKSTVVPGTTEEALKVIEKASGKKCGSDFGMCMTPEFLQEGKAMKDFFEPSRVVIGSFDKKSLDTVKQLYKYTDAPLVECDLKTAEMIKYASNSLLATKISFSNEIGNICKKLGIDTYKVMEGVGLDNRISPKFLNSGCGFGGSCFPKDVKALIAKAKELGCTAKILDEIMNTNETQKTIVVDMLKDKLDIKGKTVSLLGLAFKQDTDDIREAPAINVIKALLDSGATVKAYDPKAEENMRHVYPDIIYTKSAKDALKDADACIVLTEWKEFESLEDNDFNGIPIIEGRKVLSSSIKNKEGICW